jgi:hypothetical protein
VRACCVKSHELDVPLALAVVYTAHHDRDISLMSVNLSLLVQKYAPEMYYY